MKAYNLYFKILKKTLVVIVVNVVIFLVIAFMFTTSSNTTNEFSETKIDIAFINHDDDTILITNLKQYLSKYVSYQDVLEKDIADALYFRRIYLVLEVPKDFTKDFLSNKEVFISKQTTPDNIVEFSIELALNKYLNYVLTYQNTLNLTLEETIDEVNKVLAVKSNAKNIVNNNQIKSAEHYFNFASYLLFAVLISIIGFISLKARREEVKKRMILSPYPQTKYNLEMILGNLTFTLIFIVFIIALGLFIYPDGVMSINGIFFMINLLCLAFCALSIAYFISLVVKSEEVVAAVGNVVSISTAFLCGAFVPQALLSEGMLVFARFFPSYYFIYNNALIAGTYVFDGAILTKIFIYFGVQLSFGLVFMILSFIINKKQMQLE